MNTFVKGLYAVNKVMFLISAMLLAASIFVTFFNVIVRKFFHGLGGFTWAEEISAYACVLMLFIGVAYLEFTNQHLSIGILSSVIKNKKAQAIVDQATRIFRGAVTLFLLIIVIRSGLIVLRNMYTSNMLTYAMQLPKLYFFTPMLIGFVMVVVVWVTILVFYKGKEIKDGI